MSILFFDARTMDRPAENIRHPWAFCQFLCLCGLGFAALLSDVTRQDLRWRLWGAFWTLSYKVDYGVLPVHSTYFVLYSVIGQSIRLSLLEGNQMADPTSHHKMVLVTIYGTLELYTDVSATHNLGSWSARTISYLSRP